MLGVTQEQFLGLIRHIVTFAGGIIVARSHFDPGAVETIGGLVVTVAGMLWSFLAPEKSPAATPPAKP